METCPTCNGTGEISPSILIIDQIINQYQYILEKFDKPKLVLRTHPFIYAYLTKGFPSIKLKWRFKYNHRLTLKEDSNLGLLNFEFIDQNGDKVIV